METKKTFKSFSYETNIVWKSARRGVVRAAGKPDIEVSSPPEFKGEAGIWTPEDMFVSAVNACTLMTFVAVAMQRGLEVVSYLSLIHI